jgi:hypothetical protein
MGEAQANKERRAQKVQFDFSAPEHRILRSDKFVLSREPDGKDARTADGEIDMGRVKARASCSVIVNLVEVAYPQRMRTKDGEDYDVWLEAMDEIDQGAGYVVSVTVGDIEWLLGHLKNDGLGIPPGMVQWRVKLRQYAEGLVKEN